MRPFVFAALCLLAAACRHPDDVPYAPPPPEEVVVDLQGTGHELVFRLPDPDWLRDASFRGFRYRHEERSLEVVICLVRDRFIEVSERVSASPDATVRAFEPGSGWPFVGVVVIYRGPPDAAMLDAFERSFKLERR